LERFASGEAQQRGVAMGTFFHVVLMLGNAALAVSNAISGDYSWAAAQAALAGVLAYQLTW
jgi:hypothetical protein